MTPPPPLFSGGVAAVIAAHCFTPPEKRPSQIHDPNNNVWQHQATRLRRLFIVPIFFLQESSLVSGAIPFVAELGLASYVITY